MINYKGIFYNEEKEKKYYEGGAHFKYSDLVNILIHLIHENKKAESEDTGNSKDNLISQNNNETNIYQDIKINNPNLITLNNNKIKNNIKIINTHKFILNTDKNINIEKEKERKKRLIELLNYNVKISPSNNYNNYKKIFTNNSLDKNYKRKNLKTLGNNDNLNDSNNSNNYLSININHKKQDNINNLPLIQSSYYNNLSNKNVFEKNNNDINYNKNSIIGLKHVSKFTLNKTKKPNDNYYLKNKLFSPVKSMNNRNKGFSNDYSDVNRLYKNYDTIHILSKVNRNSFAGKLSKYLNNNLNKQKKNINLKMIHFGLNKKE